MMNMSTLDVKFTLKIAMTSILIAVNVVLSYVNPFAYFYIFGTKINPFVHLINAIAGVLLGLKFASLTALGTAIIRFSFGLGTIHAFHGGISGAIIVGLVALFLREKKPKYTVLAALFEPIGTVFIGGTIGFYIVSIGAPPEPPLFITSLSLFFMSIIIAYIIRKKRPQNKTVAALLDPIGFIIIVLFIGLLIASIGTPFEPALLFTFWWLFFLSSIVGSILGFLLLIIIKKAGYTWEDFF